MSSSGDDSWPDVFSRFIHPDRPGLFSRVDFLGLSRAIITGAFLGFLTGVASIILGFRDAGLQIYAAFEFGARRFGRELASAPGTIVGEAVRVAGNELGQFGLASLPVAMTILIITMIVTAALVYVFFVRTD